MKRSKREAARESAEHRKRSRKEFFERDRDLTNRAEINFINSIVQNNIKQKSVPSSPFMRVVAKKAPRLLDDLNYKKIVEILDSMVCVRSIDEWKPQGKGKQTLLASLAAHLLAEYPVPKFLWNSLWEEDWKKLRSSIVLIAKGHSFAKLCKTGTFPIPLTNRQCHALLQSSAHEGFISAVRRVQIQTHGGEPRLHSVWMNQSIGQRILAPANEIFWDSVMAWFCKHPLLDPSQIKPLIDFIDNRRNDDTNFSMKGRSPIAMIRAMEEWHGELYQQKIFRESNYQPSGFKSGCWQNKNKFGHIQEWVLNEILTSKELHAEGSVLRHCVASYSSSILSGAVSIWSLSCNQEKVITIEVNNASNKIVQARGKFNRVTTNEEFKIISQWAQDNNLRVSLGHF